MEHAAVQVKDEPMDYDENEAMAAQEADIEQEATKEFDDAAPLHLKIECEEPQLADYNSPMPEQLNPFKIVAEQDDIITVNAADFKSEDERVFIAGLRIKNFAKVPPAPVPPKSKVRAIVCNYCPTLRFALRSQLDVHQMLHHRSIKCLICHSYVCSTVNELAVHMQTHQEPKPESVYENPINPSKFLKNAKRNSKGKLNESERKLEFESKRKAKGRLGVSERMLEIEANIIPNLNQNIEIKQEPVDDDVTKKTEDPVAQIEPIYIKKELIEEDCEMEIKTEPNCEHDKLLNLLKQPLAMPSKSYALASSTSTKDSYLNSLRHLRLPSVKVKQQIINSNSNTDIKTPPSAPTTTTTMSRPLQMLNGNVKLSHSINAINLQGMKVVKLAPNAKIVRLLKVPQTLPQPQSKSAIPTTLSVSAILNSTLGSNVAVTAKQSVLQAKIPTESSASSLSASATKPQSLSSLTSHVGSLISPKPKDSDEETEKLLSNRGITVVKMSEEIKAASTVPAPTLSPPLVTVSLSSLRTDTTIDAQDLQKLLAQVRQKAAQNDQKILTLPNDVLHVIERMPEKRKVIDNMLQQIRALEEPGESCIRGSKQQGQLQEFDAAQATNNSSARPKSLYLRIADQLNNTELMEARALNPGYSFLWICPLCSIQCKQKPSFCGHLVKVHNICGEIFEKLIVEVRPFRDNESTESVAPVPQEIKEEPTEFLSFESAVAAIEPIKMSALKCAERKKKKVFTCTKCGRMCSSKTMLNDHVRANCSRRPLYQCPECPKRFYSTATLNCHMTIHTGELPHKCKYCEKRFRTRGQVTVHHRTHTGERPFICQVCSQSFTHRETLISHLSRHIGMKRYKCYACDKHFSCISGLKTHRDLRPTTCAKVKLCTRAIGPRVRVVRGEVIFEQQPEINPYLRTEDPQEILADIQNQLENPQT